MILNKVKLKNFRNYSEREFELENGINVVWGRNAAGKTNFLEGVAILGTGQSFKAKRIDEMVRFGEELGRVEGEFNDRDEKRSLEVIVTKGIVGGKRTVKRKYLIDGTSKRRKDYLGLFPVVVFRPEDLDLLTDGPNLRRDFMDTVLVQASEQYDRNLTTYMQALKRRNKLLDAIREGTATRYALTFWDGLLIKHGAALTEKRQELIEYINTLWGRSELFNELKLVYDKSAINESRIEQYKDEEVMAGYTLVGPHKDDFQVLNQERDLSTYGSRGEQRMVVLALKLGEIYFIENRIELKPMLLLDDIFSELDETHKQEVLRVMQSRQVIVTTATKDDLRLLDKAKVFELI